MSIVKQLVRYILLVHGLLNVTQGAYSVFKPIEFAATAGTGFDGAPNKAIQSIGLGSIGVGIYGALGAWTNERRFYAVTAAMRLLFGALIFTQMGWETNIGIVMYELSVATVAALAALI